MALKFLDDVLIAMEDPGLLENTDGKDCPSNEINYPRKLVLNIKEEILRNLFGSN